jgi:hypothetical protein
MTELEYLLMFFGNGITTALVLGINDRLFRRQIDKVLNKMEKEIKKNLYKQ